MSTFSYYTKYEGTQEEKDKKAIEDIRFYLGEERFEAAEKLIDKSINYKQFVFSVEFLGVVGYPVEAWARKLGVKIS